ncbi:hypothetical protein [Streptomyces sp. LBL]|uniref:hypothetical protein n=1 Tax=Streptomyces sp. LBL TaxID=2940562 RepID=UPI00247511D9|nr:hypothetical protein [Streptomyces sp. LBL]
MPDLPGAEPDALSLLGTQLLDRTHEDIKISGTHPALLPPGSSHGPSRLGHRLGGTTQSRKILTGDAENTVQRTPQTRLRHLIRSPELRRTVQDMGGIQQQTQRPLPVAALSLQRRDELRTQPTTARPVHRQKRGLDTSPS